MAITSCFKGSKEKLKDLNISYMKQFSSSCFQVTLWCCWQTKNFKFFSSLNCYYMISIFLRIFICFVLFFQISIFLYIFLVNFLHMAIETGWIDGWLVGWMNSRLFGWLCMYGLKFIFSCQIHILIRNEFEIVFCNSSGRNFCYCCCCFW